MRLKNRVTILSWILLALAAPFLCSAETAPKTTETVPSSQAEVKEPPAAPADKEQGFPPLPTSTEITHNYEGAFVRMLVTLGGLIALVIATFWFLRRIGKGSFRSGNGQGINIIEKRPLSPKSMLYLIEYENKKILIAESQLEVRALSTFEAEVSQE